jgi:hypothetical protein
MVARSIRQLNIESAPTAPKCMADSTKMVSQFILVLLRAFSKSVAVVMNIEIRASSGLVLWTCILDKLIVGRFTREKLLCSLSVARALSPCDLSDLNRREGRVGNARIRGRAGCQRSAWDNLAGILALYSNLPECDTRTSQCGCSVKCTRANHGLILPRVVMTAWPKEIQRKAALEDLKQRCFTETSIRS